MKRCFVLLLGGLLALASGVHAAPLPGDSLYQTPLVVRDQQGRRFTLASLRGRPLIVSMFYASCTSICPLTIEAIERMRRAASAPAHEELAVLMISFDPSHDSVDKLSQVARAHRLDPAHWHVVRPERGDIDAFAATLGVAYRARADGEITHNAVVALLDQDGRIVARTGEAERLDPAFVDALRQWTNRQ